MKNKRIKILISVMTFALLGLISLQVFWSVKIIETEKIKFDATINRVLSNVVLKIEKDRTASILIEKVGGKNGNILWVENNVNQKDSNKIIFFSSNGEDEELIVDGEKIEINVEISEDEEYRKKSGKRVLKRIVTVDTKGKDSNNNRESKIDTLSFNKEHLITEVLEDMISFKNENYFNDILDEKVVDSLINMELNWNGLETEYYFGVVNKGKKEFLIIKSGSDENQLILSKYYKPLSPHDMFSNSLMLKIFIPNVFGLILKSIWVMFAFSLLFIFVIIFVYVKTVKMFLEQKKVAEVKNDLINNITHEFKTPIAAISLASEALTEPKLSEQKDSIKRYTKIIDEENKKLTQLVETLLNTAAFEKSEIELDLKIVDVGSIIDDLVLKARDRNCNVNISFLNKMYYSEKVKIDIFHFTNIINNLIDNAIKYSEDNIEIKIVLEFAKNRIKISISDKGIGIKKTDQQKIFDTFFRVQTGNIHNVKGNGIGLSYVKRIIEAHNGIVRVESKLNVGSTFIIYLPYEK